MTSTPVAELTGTQKAAVLLLWMGREQAARVLRNLRETEVTQIMAEVARLRSVDQDSVLEVLQEFQLTAEARKQIATGGVDVARELLEDSLGQQKANEIFEQLSLAFVAAPFEFLRRADPRQVLRFLQDEHPQTIALVLAHMGADNASAVLGGLSPVLQADVAHRIAVMDRTSPEIIKSVEANLERRLSSVLQPSDFAEIGGIAPLVDIINRADRATERLILEGLEGRDPVLADEVRSRMFMFEDIIQLEDRAIQLVLRQVETSDLATALKGVREEVKEKITKNLSERAAENLMEEIELLGPVRLRTVEESQAKFVQAIRVLEASGEIVVRRGSDDDFVA